jgi:hypothetical protein
MIEQISRFAMHATDLDLFLTRLTYLQLWRHTELLMLKLAEQSILQNYCHHKHDLAARTDELGADVAVYLSYLVYFGFMAEPFSFGLPIIQFKP